MDLFGFPCENYSFLKEIEKGMIPEELILNEPGNFEISYVDKKNEVYINNIIFILQ